MMFGAAPQGSSRVEHFDGSTWSTVNEVPEMERLFVWGFAAGDVFVGGSIADVGTIYHFDGQDWDVPRPGRRGHLAAERSSTRKW